jgi:hypothetical protein
MIELKGIFRPHKIYSNLNGSMYIKVRGRRISFDNIERCGSAWGEHITIKANGQEIELDGILAEYPSFGIKLLTDNEYNDFEDYCKVYYLY